MPGKAPGVPWEALLLVSQGWVRLYQMGALQGLPGALKRYYLVTRF